MWLWLAGCPHAPSALVDRVEPPACAAARQAGTREGWAQAFWADPEAGCHDEALDGLRRLEPELMRLGTAGESEVSILSSSGRVPKAVEDLLASISAPMPRVWFTGSHEGEGLDGSLVEALEPVRAAVDGCVPANVSGRVRLLGAIGPSGVVRVGAIDGDQAVARCVTGVDEAELPPSSVARPLDVTIVVDKG